MSASNWGYTTISESSHGFSEDCLSLRLASRERLGVMWELPVAVLIQGGLHSRYPLSIIMLPLQESTDRDRGGHNSSFNV
jgi:hypothetical protein